MMNPHRCPNCGGPFTVDASLTGTVVQCPTCKVQIQIPARSAQRTPASASPPPPAIQTPQDDFSWLSEGASSGTSSKPTSVNRRTSNRPLPKTATPYVVAGIAVTGLVGIIAVIVATGAFKNADQTAPPPRGAPQGAATTLGDGLRPNLAAPAKSFENSYAEGQKYLDDGDNEAAVKLFTVAISVNSKSAAALNGRGVAYLRLNKRGSALDDFNRATLLEPNTAKYYRNRAFVYLGQEKYELALADQSKAIDLSPETPDIYDERANTYLFIDKKDEAANDRATAARLRGGAPAIAASAAQNPLVAAPLPTSRVQNPEQTAAKEKERQGLLAKMDKEQATRTGKLKGNCLPPQEGKCVGVGRETALTR